MKMLEDVGFYCVDNLPVSFIEKFVGLVSAPNNEISKVALGLDARANQSFDEVERILENLRKDGCKFEILFMDASDQVLLKRYKETRRVHPLSPEGRVEDGISREREILKEIKGKADYVIDSSSLLTRSPASMISFPAKCPAGRLKVLPALGYSKGCFSRLRAASSSI